MTSTTMTTSSTSNATACYYQSSSSSSQVAPAVIAKVREYSTFEHVISMGILEFAPDIAFQAVSKKIREEGKRILHSNMTGIPSSISQFRHFAVFIPNYRLGVSEFYKYIKELSIILGEPHRENFASVRFLAKLDSDLDNALDDPTRKNDHLPNPGSREHFMHHWVVVGGRCYIARPDYRADGVFPFSASYHDASIAEDHQPLCDGSFPERREDCPSYARRYERSGQMTYAVALRNLEACFLPDTSRSCALM